MPIISGKIVQYLLELTTNSSLLSLTVFTSQTIVTANRAIIMVAQHPKKQSLPIEELLLDAVLAGFVSPEPNGVALVKLLHSKKVNEFSLPG